MGWRRWSRYLVAATRPNSLGKLPRPNSLGKFFGATRVEIVGDKPGRALAHYVVEKDKPLVTWL